MVELISGSAEDLYFAIEYFNDCIYHEEERNETFLINREELANLISNAIGKNWTELKYGGKFFDLQLIYIWNRRCQRKYGFSFAPKLEKLARRIHFESNETTLYYENLIKKAIENDEVMDLLRGEGNYKFRMTQYTDTELIRETTTRLVCCFYMQMGRIDDIDKIFCESLKKLYLGNVKDVFLGRLYIHENLYYDMSKKATFYIDFTELNEIIREGYNKYKQELNDGIEFDGVKIKIPWGEVMVWDSELMKNCAYKFNCHYV